MSLNFWKMNGAGNDFVVIDNRDLAHNLSQAQIERLCNRQRGIGSDGYLAVEPAQNGADYRMRYYNADGGEAEMCGNGARCFARFVSFLNDGATESITFETMAGVISADFVGENVRIGLSEPFDLKMNQNLDVNGETKPIHSVNTGVPHAVLILEELASADIIGLGSSLRYHEAFQPAGTNANLMEVRGPQEIAIRTYERGVEDETLACGTGMVANAIVHHELTGEPSPIRVHVKGGEELLVEFEKTDAGYRNVFLTGPADLVFEGSISLD